MYVQIAASGGRSPARRDPSEPRGAAVKSAGATGPADPAAYPVDSTSSASGGRAATAASIRAAGYGVRRLVPNSSQ